MAATAHRTRQSIVEALETKGDAISWRFAHADAIEAGREAERFHRQTLMPLADKKSWTDEELARLMDLEYRYQDMSRFSRMLMDGLMARPAPDLAALLWKLEYLFGGKGGLAFPEGMPEPMVSAVMADARRLLGRDGETA